MTVLSNGLDEKEFVFAFDELYDEIRKGNPLINPSEIIKILFIPNDMLVAALS